MLSLGSQTFDYEALMIRQLVDDPDIGWHHPNTIILAFNIVTEFGGVLDKTSWMVFGAPESLLPTSKGNVQTAFEVLYKFLHNKTAWNNFRIRYPENARSIISNNFYKALINALPLVENYISDEEANICVKAAKCAKSVDSDKLREFLKSENKIENFFEIQSKISKRRKDLFNYLDSQELFIKSDIFD